MADLALTTVFTPPSSCFNNVYTSFGNLYEKDVYIESAECYPPSYRAIFSEEIPYSPGVCPSGYSYDSVTPYNGDATAALCCPLGMTAMQQGLGCQTEVDGATELYVGGSTTTVEEPLLAAYGVYVAWGSDDDLQDASTTAASTFSTIVTPEAYPAHSSSQAVARSTSSELAAASSSSRTVASSNDESTTRTTSEPATALTLTTSQPGLPPSTVTVVGTHSPSQPTQTPTPMSTGAKAGIGVGASIGGIAVVAAGAWFIFRKRRKDREARAYMSSQPEMHGTNGDFAPGNKAHHVSELSTEGGRSELSGTLPWIEATPKERRVELDGQ